MKLEERIAELLPLETDRLLFIKCFFPKDEARISYGGAPISFAIELSQYLQRRNQQEKLDLIINAIDNGSCLDLVDLQESTTRWQDATKPMAKLLPYASSRRLFLQMLFPSQLQYAEIDGVAHTSCSLILHAAKGFELYDQMVAVIEKLDRGEALVS